MPVLAGAAPLSERVLAACLSPRRTYYRYNGHTFTHKEGLLAYAGARRYEDIAHKVKEIPAVE